MISQRIFQFLTDEENIVRILKYWWIISTLRIAIGTIIFLIILFGIYDIASLR